MNRRLLSGVICAGILIASMGTAVLAQSTPETAAITATPGQDVKMMLLPKFLGIVPFDQAHQGAEEAAAELQNPTKLDFVGPTAENSVAGQIEFMTNAPAGEYDVVMLSNNSGDQIAPSAPAVTASSGVISCVTTAALRRMRAFTSASIQRRSSDESGLG